MRQGLFLAGLAVTLGVSAPAFALRMTDPYPFRCDDGAEFTVAFVAQPAIVFLVYEGRGYELWPQRSASGARYVTVDVRGDEISFWNKGKEAVFEFPGQASRHCRAVE